MAQTPPPQPSWVAGFLLLLLSWVIWRRRRPRWKTQRKEGDGRKGVWKGGKMRMRRRRRTGLFLAQEEPQRTAMREERKRSIKRSALEQSNVAALLGGQSTLGKGEEEKQLWLYPDGIFALNPPFAKKRIPPNPISNIPSLSIFSFSKKNMWEIFLGAPAPPKPCPSPSGERWLAQGICSRRSGLTANTAEAWKSAKKTRQMLTFFVFGFRLHTLPLRQTS